MSCRSHDIIKKALVFENARCTLAWINHAVFSRFQFNGEKLKSTLTFFWREAVLMEVDRQVTKETWEAFTSVFQPLWIWSHDSLVMMSFLSFPAPAMGLVRCRFFLMKHKTCWWAEIRRKDVNCRRAWDGTLTRGLRSRCISQNITSEYHDITAEVINTQTAFTPDLTFTVCVCVLLYNQSSVNLTTVE